MTHDEAAALIQTIRSFVQDAPAKPLGRPGPPPAAPPNGKPKEYTPQESFDFERIYLAFKARLVDELREDPILLQLIMQRPELVVEFEPRVVTISGNTSGTTRERVARLIALGWFDEAKTTGGTRRELTRTGADPGGGGTLSDVLASYVRDGFLTREGDGYSKAPGLKVTEKELVAR